MKVTPFRSLSQAARSGRLCARTRHLTPCLLHQYDLSYRLMPTLRLPGVSLAGGSQMGLFTSISESPLSSPPARASAARLFMRDAATCVRSACIAASSVTLSYGEAALLRPERRLRVDR